MPRGIVRSLKSNNHGASGRCGLWARAWYGVAVTVEILWGSPLPPIRSGISDYAVELLPELARLAKVRVLRPPDWEPAKGLGLDSVDLVDHQTTPKASEIALIHMGNNPYHEWLLPHLERGGAVVVVHDLIMHHLLIESTVAHGRVLEYSRRIAAAHGPAGAALGAARQYDFWARLDPFLLPARRAFLTKCRGLIVHSEFGRLEVEADFPHIPVLRTALAVADPGHVDREAERAALGIDPCAVVLMHLGFLTPAKGVREILGAVASAAIMGVDVRLVVVGEGQMMETMRVAMRDLGLRDRVIATGWVTPDRLQRLPAAADLGVVLRTPSAGETSAAALRFLACGTPVAVTGHRQFLELGSEAALRVTPGPSATADLTRILYNWTADPNGVADRRQAARRLYEDDGHRPAAVAESLVSWLEESPAPRTPTI